MKKALLIVLLAMFGIGFSFAQDISIRVVQSSYNPVDPDGAGEATGSVTYRFELMASAGTINLEGVALSNLYQSSHLMPTPTSTTVRLGPLAAVTGWTQAFDDRAGTDVSSFNLNYGGRTFDRRTYFQFSAAAVGPVQLPLPNVWTPVLEVTYYTKGTAAPQGGYITPQPGFDFPQNGASGDGGSSEYFYLSPNAGIPVPLGVAIPTPVTFTGYDVTCGSKGTLVTWVTGSEVNASHYEIERSINGSAWTKIDHIAAAGNSNTTRNYQYLDLQGGDAFYRIRQVDIDGRFVHTAIKHVNCEGKKGSVVLFPIPASNVLNVAISHDKAIRTELQVVDMSGRIVKRQAVAINNGNTNFTIDVSKLAMGEYILTSSDKTIQLNKTFTIVR